MRELVLSFSASLNAASKSGHSLCFSSYEGGNGMVQVLHLFPWSDAGNTRTKTSSSNSLQNWVEGNLRSLPLILANRGQAELEEARPGERELGVVWSTSPLT